MIISKLTLNRSYNSIGVGRSKTLKVTLDQTNSFVLTSFANISDKTQFELTQVSMTITYNVDILWTF